MGNAKRIKEQKKPKEINEEELKALVEECKIAYPQVQPILLHMACIDFLMHPTQKKFSCEMDDAINEKITAMKKEIGKETGSIRVEDFSNVELVE